MSSRAPASPPDPSALDAATLDALRGCLGDDGVVLDRAEREACSADLYAAGATCAAVLRPADREALARAVPIAATAGYALVARGGGLTYTGGCTPPHERTLVVDLARLDRIVALAADDMYVTVEPGVTWRALHAALAPHGLRLPCFGTFSGAGATVGGGLSNGALWFGTARWGTVADALLALEVLLPDGTLVRTGQAAIRGAQPFYRTYGPELTSAFVHDAGTLGIKTLATFRLIRLPAATGHASFAFGELASAAAALSEIARAGVAEDAYVFDPSTTRRNLAATDFTQALRSLAGVVRGERGLLRGLRAGVKLAAAGRDFGANDVYSLHVTAAASSEAGLAADLDRCRALAAECGGAEIPSSIPTAVRGEPFPPLNGVLGPEGERWVALNAKVPHSRAAALVEAAEVLLARDAAAFAAHGITVSRVLIAVSNHSFSYEPVYHWRDTWLPAHRLRPEPAHLATLTEPPPAPEARAVVARARADMVALFAAHGAASNQIGRTYPWFELLEPGTARLLAALKAAADPQGCLNPGALGLRLPDAAAYTPGRDAPGRARG